jgi:hypothetical protein
VFEPARHLALLFGGGDAAAVRDDTWTFDGQHWQLLAPALSPPPRSDHGLLHDPATGHTVLFGGVGADGLPLADTWVWDGVSWTQIVTATAPGPRSSFAFVQDSVRQRGVLWGGCDANDWPLSDTWEFDGALWRLRRPSEAPVATASPAAAFDPGLESTVLLGGRSGALQARTWLYGARVIGRVSSFGEACTGAAPLALTAVRPWVGQPWVARVASTVAGPLLLLHGSSNRMWAGVPLPLALDAFGAAGCRLLVAPESSHASSGTDFRFWIPAQPSLVGGTFYMQVVRVEAAANALGVVTGNALEAVIGAR